MPLTARSIAASSASSGRKTLRASAPGAMAATSIKAELRKTASGKKA